VSSFLRGSGRPRPVFGSESKIKGLAEGGRNHVIGTGSEGN
jgi:hypothetical protein